MTLRDLRVRHFEAACCKLKSTHIYLRSFYTSVQAPHEQYGLQTLHILLNEQTLVFFQRLINQYVFPALCQYRHLCQYRQLSISPFIWRLGSFDYLDKR